MPTRRGAVVPGLMLLLLGAWLLARNLNVPVPGLDRLWPGIIVLFGLAFLGQFAAGGRRDEGLVFVGLAGTLLGVFFLTITLGYLDWGDLGRLWPVFVLIGGLAFLGQWLAKPADRGLLIPAVMVLLVGGVALVFSLGLLSPELAAQAARLWPLGLILLGMALLISYLRAPNGRA
jgi:hypothetical protein